MTSQWGFRSIPATTEADLIATATGVILMRYFGFEDNYIEGAQTNIVNFTYHLSTTREDQYLFTNRPYGIASIESTWAGIATLMTLGNLSLVDIDGVAAYLEQFRNTSGGYNETILPSSFESTYWAIETLRLIDPLTPTELLTSAMKIETRNFLRNRFDNTNNRFDDPSYDDDDESYQLSTYYALMTLRAMDEQQEVVDIAVNIAEWIASTQYYDLYVDGSILPNDLNGGFADRPPASEDFTRLIPTAAGLASLRILNETVPEDLFSSIMINTTLAENFIIQCNLGGGGFTDRPGGSINQYSIENIFFALMGFLSSGKLLEVLDSNPIFYPLPQNQLQPIVRGDDVSIMFSPNFYGEGPHEDLELEVTIDGHDFGIVQRNENASIPNTYQLNISSSEFPNGMFLGNHSLVTQIHLRNQVLIPTFSVHKQDNMTVGVNLRYEVDAESYIPGNVISFNGNLTDRVSNTLNGNLTAKLVDPIGTELTQTVFQAVNGIINGNIQIPNAPLLGNHSLIIQMISHTVNTTRISVFDQPVLMFIESNSFEGPTSRTYHIGDNISILAQVRYTSTRQILDAYVRNLTGYAQFMYSNETLFFGIFQETDVPGHYNISGTIPQQLFTGSINVTAEIFWPNTPTTTTDPIDLQIATNFELTERTGFPSPNFTLQYGRHFNWTFKVLDLFSNRIVETVTLAPGLSNRTSSHLLQNFSYSQLNNTFTIEDVPSPNLPQGSYNLHIKGLLPTNESYIDLMSPIPLTIDGQLELQHLRFLSDSTINPGQILIVDFLIVNAAYNNEPINDVIGVSTLSGPDGTYTVNFTRLGVPPQLIWIVPENASQGIYTATFSRSIDMLPIGSFEFTVEDVVVIDEPRPWQFYAVLVLGIIVAGLLLGFFRQAYLKKRKV